MKMKIVNLRRWLESAPDRDIRCVFGHKRGVRIGVAFSKRQKALVEYKCPRCNAKWTRRPRKEAYDDSVSPIWETVGAIGEQNTAAQEQAIGEARSVEPASAVPDPLDHLGAIRGDKSIAPKDYGEDSIVNRDGVLLVRKQEE